MRLGGRRFRERIAGRRIRELRGGAANSFVSRRPRGPIGSAGLVGLAVAAFLAAASASAQKTDVVVLQNGDRITGEIKAYTQGKLVLDTSHSSLVKVKWSLIDSITSTKEFEIELIDGSHVYGTLSPSDPPGLLSIVSPSGSMNVSFFQLYDMTPVFRHFWDRWDGSLDMGFNYTQSSSLIQFNLDAGATYKLRQAQYVTNLSVFFSRQDDVTAASRASFSTRYERFLENRWLVQGGIGLERNVQLGLDLRVLAGAAFGRNFVQTNQTQLGAYAGIVGTHEQPVEGESGYSVEGVVGGRYSYFMYDFPNATLSASVQVFPSFTVGGRVRLEATASARREIVSDFYLSLSVFDSFDSRDPSTLQSKNDWGPTVSIGWSF